MRHIIIASHYGLAAGLGDTLKAIIGPGHDIRVVCAFTDETPLEEKLASAFEGIAEDDETLVLTDILQGSRHPSQRAARLPRRSYSGR